MAVNAVSHAINRHVLTGKNPCINQAIHVLLMHGFCTLHKRISKSLLWNTRFQNLPIIHAFVRHYSNTKMIFSKRFSKGMTLCNNNDQTCFSDILTSA